MLEDCKRNRSEDGICRLDLIETSRNLLAHVGARIAGIDGIDVALQGRVPCQVTGTVTRGDLMVTSAIPGVAMTNNNPAIGTVIGKALGNHIGASVGVIEVVVGRV